MYKVNNLTTREILCAKNYYPQRKSMDRNDSDYYDISSHGKTELSSTVDGELRPSPSNTPPSQHSSRSRRVSRTPERKRVYDHRSVRHHTGHPPHQSRSPFPRRLFPSPSLLVGKEVHSPRNPLSPLLPSIPSSPPQVPFRPLSPAATSNPAIFSTAAAASRSATGAPRPPRATAGFFPRWATGRQNCCCGIATAARPGGAAPATSGAGRFVGGRGEV